MFKKLYCGVVCIGDAFQPILLLALRLYWGFAFFQSGYGKLGSIGETAHFFSDIGIPFPTANAYIAGGIECAGGVLLLLGFFSRLAAIPLIIVMLTAYYTAHHEALVNIWGNPAQFIAEQPFNFLLTALLVFAFGPGKLSLDYLICKMCFQKNCTPDSKNGGNCHKS